MVRINPRLQTSNSTWAATSPIATTRQIDRIVELARESISVKEEKRPEPIEPREESPTPCSIVLPIDRCSREDLLIHPSRDRNELRAGAVRGSDRSLGEENHDDIFENLSGDLRILTGSADWSYGQACNHAALQARGKYVVFIKPGMVPEKAWLEGLLEVAEDDAKFGIVGGQLLNREPLDLAHRRRL